MSGTKKLKVFAVESSKDPYGDYSGYFVIQQDDANVFEFSNRMHQDTLERYDEFVITRTSDGKTFVAKDLLIDGDTRPTKYDKNGDLLGFPHSYQVFRFSCKSFS